MKKRYFLPVLLGILSLGVVLTACNKKNSDTGDSEWTDPGVWEPDNNNDSPNQNPDEGEGNFVEGVGLFTEIIENDTIVGYELNSADPEKKTIIIPEKHKNLPVISIGYEAFAERYDLESVTIPDSVTRIGDDAFRNCGILTSVTMGTLVSSIGEGAFKGCSSLRNITIPASMTKIENSVFSGCGSLTRVEIPKGITSIGNSAFLNCYKLVEIYNYSDLKLAVGSNEFGHIAQYAKVIHTQEEASIIETTKDGLYDYFVWDNQCYLLLYKGKEKGITLPNNLGGNTYELYPHLFDERDLFVDSYVAEKRNLLTSVTISSGVTRIGDYAFYYCRNLSNITISDSVVSIGDSAFQNCNNFKNITIPNSVESIGDYVFRNCNSLTSITIGNGVESIGVEAFGYCDKLDKVYYDGTAENWCQIGFNSDRFSTPMFYANHFYMKNGGNWEEVTRIEIPDGVTKIGTYQFYGFKNLTSVSIPNSVTTIGDYAFDQCESLIYHESGDGFYLGNAENPVLFMYKVNNENITETTISANTKFFYANAFLYCEQLDKVYYEGTIENWCQIGFGGDSIGSTPMCHANHFYMRKDSDWEEVTSIEISEDITKIGNFQFYGFRNVTSILLPETITKIGTDAFRDCCRLAAIKIPDSVTSIGKRAFYGCSEMSWVIVGEKVTTIEKETFYDCSSLMDVTLGNQVKTIDEAAFYRCSSLRSIILPKSIVSVGKNAFRDYQGGCKVYYTGTKEDWELLKIGDYNYALENGTIYYYSDDHSASGHWWKYDNQGYIQSWDNA